jgi:WD40 repeat protein
MSAQNKRDPSQVDSSPRTGRPCAKQQKMSDNLPNNVIVDRILPFVDRPTWDNLVVANREIYEGSRNLEAPWPVGELIEGGYEADEINQLCFSPDGRYLCVRSATKRIRLWHKVVGSCGRIDALDFGNRVDGYGYLLSVCFSPVENLLASLHDDDEGSNAFQLWEVNTGGVVLKGEVRLNEEVYGCAFSRDGRRLILICRDSNLRVYSVSNAQLIKVIHLNGDRQEFFNIVGTTADGRQVNCIYNQLNSPVRLCDIYGDASTFEDVYVCQEGESVSEIAISPLDDSIAIMTRTGAIKVAHRRARDMAWTIEVVADGKCFDIGNLSFSTSGQLLATAHVDGGVEIWDPIKGNHLRTIACSGLWDLEFSPDGRLLAATSLDGDAFLFNI